ncbi:MAG: fused MFS/spermidine synthase [Alphaproteobacteria bacterium]
MTTAKKSQATLVIFGLTLFLSAALMFAVQPMVGKMLLPIVGGTPAGWIVAMAFFQIMLLAGYLVAHLFSTFPARTHGILYILGLLAGTLFLPPSLAGHANYATTPGAYEIFVLLTFCIAIPFIALSATSSTIQRLFTVTEHGAAGDPYFLYVASNLGSFSGLLLYPFLIEPAMAIDLQAKGLYGGYVLLIFFGLWCLLLARGVDARAAVKKTAGKLPPAKKMAEWAALAFVPSSLLMGVTTFITTDVISAPMVWIIPLAFYLVTFVIAFASKPVVSAARMHSIHPYAICAGIFFISLMQARWLGDWLGVGFYLAIFFCATLSCHLRLASLRPLDDSRHLTAFYLMMSVGGALGGVLNAFIVPYVFNRPVEFPLMLLASALLLPDFKVKSRVGMAIIVLLGISVLLVNMPAQHLGIDSIQARTVLAYALLIGFAFGVAFYRKTILRLQPMALAALLVFMVTQFVVADESEILRTRNFYGIVRLFDNKVIDPKTKKEYHILVMRHGSTIHGKQVVDPKLSLEPTAYHVRNGPLGDLFAVYKPKKVAVLGLGIGVMNCYNAKDREFTFVEIDPAVVKVAEENFTFLSACKSKTKPRIIVGDGRLELGKLKGEKFDMLVMDAFTSDSIPTHLITKEAFALYLEHLKPGGVVVVNVSNRYFNLRDTIAATAKTLELKSSFAPGIFKNGEKLFYGSESLWMVVTRPAVSFKALPARWGEVTPPANVSAWTDNYTDLLHTLTLTGNSRLLK